MTRQDLGAPPSGPHDVTTVSWVYETFPSYSQTVTTGIDYVVDLPGDPVDHTMFVLEVNATAEVAVSLPEGVLLTTGTGPVTVILGGKTGFLGFRYSATAGSWFFLSVTSQV